MVEEDGAAVWNWGGCRGLAEKRVEYSVAPWYGREDFIYAVHERFGAVDVNLALEVVIAQSLSPEMVT